MSFSTKTAALMSCLTLILVGTACHDFALHPLVSQQDALMDDRLIGTWVEDSKEAEIIVISRAENERVYRLQPPKDDSKQQMFELRLTEIGGQVYADYSEVVSCDDCLVGHLFMKLDLERDRFRLHPMTNEELQVDGKPLARTEVEGKKVLLTPTAELRQAVAEFNDTELDEDEWVSYRRVY